jgi:hypothetical protein
MKQYPSSGTNRSSNNQEISHIFRHPRVHYCIHNNLPMVTILHQVNQDHTLPTCFIYDPLYYHLPIYNLISETVFISLLSSTTVLPFVYISTFDIMSTRLISQTHELWVCPYALSHQMTNNIKMVVEWILTITADLRINNQQDASSIRNFILSRNSTFRASSVPVIMSYQPYTWQLVCFMQVMWESQSGTWLS